ncbi:MAG: ferritin family protein [candidate division WOR-3 bacterium]|nr:ferritin family protein [candidate division WOR-3 bacterium]MDH5682855.1 ferritin family protein [candidate division WOR-3 bacterium]
MDNSVIKALATALEAEKTGLINYLNFAYQIKDETGKNMFLRLAMDEFDHMRLLEQQEYSIQKEKCFLAVTIEPSAIEKLVPKLQDKDLRIRGKQGIDQLSALKTALELEDQAIKFYRAQAQTSTDLNAKAMFERLVDMEQAHYELLQAEIDAIEKTGFWFNLREFSLEIE